MNAIEKFSWDLKITAGSRFNGAARLRRSYKRKQWSLVAFSLVSVFASLITIAFQFEEQSSKLVAVVSLIVSIVIVVFSASQIESGDIERSIRLYDSAVEISNLRREFEACLNKEKVAQLPGFSKKYNSMIEYGGVNHDDIDYAKYKRDHRSEFSDENGESGSKVFVEYAFNAIKQGTPEAVTMAAIAGMLSALLSALI